MIYASDAVRSSPHPTGPDCRSGLAREPLTRVEPSKRQDVRGQGRSYELAHGNHFNRWVAGPGARYFEGEQQCADQLDAILSDPAEIERMRAASRERYGAMFTWERVLGEYEGLLESGSRGKVQGSS